MSTKVPPVPHSTVMEDQNGFPAFPWSSWFNAVLARIGGATALTNAELAAMFPVGTANIADGAVIAPKIATGAVGSTQIATGAVGSGAIASGAVGSGALAAGGVGSTALANGGVSSVKLLSTDWTNSIVANGYQKLHTGLYIQWGTTGSIATGGSGAVTFGTAFPTACLIVLACVKGGATATTSTGQWSTNTYTASGFTLFNSTSIANAFTWVALGN